MAKSQVVCSLLALCARGQGQPDQYRQLQQQARQLTTWADIPAQAEAHGLGPLVYTHLQAAQITWPLPAKQALQANYLRHSHANQVRTNVLVDILTAYQAANIPVLVLKGAALAHLIYPTPALRSMRDIDILVPRSVAAQAHTLLTELGFETLPGVAGSLPPTYHHLPVMQRMAAGMVVGVEVHRHLFPTEWKLGSCSFNDLGPSAIPFTIKGITAYTLSYEDMLWHLYRHTFSPLWVFLPMRLIGVADMVSLVEKFVDQIDWDIVKHRYPQILNILPMLHFLTPWSTMLLRKLPLEVTNIPAGVGHEFAGWPRFSPKMQQEKGWSGILRDSFFPPEWWLRMYYGLGPGISTQWGRWIRHPLYILGHVARYYLNQKL